MDTNQRDTYRAFAAEVSDLPLFMQPWYLDAVCRDAQWDAALVQKGGRTVAALPFFLKKKWGWRYVSMPQLCKQMGPYLLQEYRTLKWEMRLYEALIEQLPADLAAFEQNFNYSVTNWLPFYWRGFKQTCLYSYVLPLQEEEALIFKNIEKNYRQKIRSAEEKINVREDLPLAELHRLVGLSFERQSLEPPVDFAFLQNLYAALSEHESGKLFFAVDADGQVHSAALLVWDKQSAYYLMSGDDPALRASGAAVLLKWAAIRYAKNVLGVPIFDFEGSMLRGVEQGRRDFGAQQRAYFRVRREWSVWWKWGKMLRQ